MQVVKRDGRASFEGLTTCGWPGCPGCGPKIAAERAADIATALTTHHEHGGKVALVTLTLPHKRSQALAELLTGLGKGWRSAYDNRAPSALLERHAIGWIRRVEITDGPNGWHPHVHLLLFLTADTANEHLAALADAFYEAWSGRLHRLGLGLPSRRRGVDARMLDLTAAREDVGAYVVKSAAYELASAGTKVGRRSQHRTPHQLLYDLGRHGEAEDLARWLEFEAGIAGRRHLEWSRGLRKLLVGSAPELTDEQAAASTDGLARLIVALTPEVWHRVRRSKPGPAVLITAAELYDDDDESADAVRRHVHRITHHQGGRRGT